MTDPVRDAALKERGWRMVDCWTSVNVERGLTVQYFSGSDPDLRGWYWGREGPGKNEPIGPCSTLAEAMDEAERSVRND